MIKFRNLYIGPAGWSYPDWKGFFYPHQLPRGLHELTYLAAYFDLVEINSTYYHPQSPNACRRWIAKVVANPRFRFTAKLWQKFVLERSSYTSDDVALVRQGMDVLLEAGRLGALLMQFPQSFHQTLENRSWLFRLITAFRMYPLVVEVRHNSWNAPEVLKFFQEQEIGFANIDQPVIGRGLPFTSHVTGNIAYFRFHGRNRQNWFNEKATRDERYDYNYSISELEELIPAVEAAMANAREVYGIFNNHFHGQAAKNALEFAYLLTGEKVKIPAPLLQNYPGLVELRQPDHPDQMELFE